jgi:hypothetical protein
VRRQSSTVDDRVKRRCLTDRLGPCPAASDKGVAPDRIDELMGWSRKGMQGIDGKGLRASALKEAIEKIEYLGLDLTHLFPR